MPESSVLPQVISLIGKAALASLLFLTWRSRRKACRVGARAGAKAKTKNPSSGTGSDPPLGGRNGSGIGTPPQPIEDPIDIPIIDKEISTVIDQPSSVEDQVGNDTVGVESDGGSGIGGALDDQSTALDIESSGEIDGGNEDSNAEDNNEDNGSDAGDIDEQEEQEQQAVTGDHDDDEELPLPTERVPYEILDRISMNNLRKLMRYYRDNRGVVLDVQRLTSDELLQFLFQQNPTYEELAIIDKKMYMRVLSWKDYKNYKAVTLRRLCRYKNISESNDNYDMESRLMGVGTTWWDLRTMLGRSPSCMFHIRFFVEAAEGQGEIWIRNQRYEF